MARSLCGKAGDEQFPASAYLPLAASGHEGVAHPERIRVLGLMLSSLLPERTIGTFGFKSSLLAVAHVLQGASAPDPAVVASAFGLTRAEARIAIAITLGLSVEQIAEQRSQVKSMLAKMGCTRQSEVVSRVLSLPGMRCDGETAHRPRRPTNYAAAHARVVAPGPNPGAQRMRTAPRGGA